MFSKNPRLNSPKYVQKKRREFVTAIILLVLFMSALAGVFVLILRSSVLEIKSVETSGAVNLPSQIIQANTLSALQGQYFKVIPKSNIVFYSKENLEKILKDNFKEIDSVEIKRKGLSKISIDIKERIPAAIVCSGFHEEDMEINDCYLSDNSGYVFGKAERPYSENYNRYYVSTTKGDIVPGEFFVDQKRFGDLQTFMNGVSRAGISPLGILIGDDGEYEMYITPDTTIYFDDRLSFDNTLSNLLAFWQDAHKKETIAPHFDYINLRFGNTIYYSDNAKK